MTRSILLALVSVSFLTGCPVEVIGMKDSGVVPIVSTDSDTDTGDQFDWDDNDDTVTDSDTDVPVDTSTDTSVDSDTDSGGDTADTGLVDGDLDGVTADVDCDDADPTVGAPSNSYADVDGDGYGDDSTAYSACTIPPTFIEIAGDCDDGDSTINPGATEVCNGFDDDCDGLVDDADDSVSDQSVFFADGDSDGFGDRDSWMANCVEPPGYTSDDSDCDDTDASVNPDATEADATVCADGLDNDCNGASDGDDAQCVDYLDEDADGVTPSEGDCDDANASESPDLTEASEVDCADGFDNDCDGASDGDDSVCIDYIDSDVDGWTVSEGDCNDSSSSTNPVAFESCSDGLDSDCDGDNSSTETDCAYTDVDGDGYSAPTDCNDLDSGINPGAEEIVDNGDDENCDGVIGSSLDIDDDGDSYTENDDDCDDSDATVSPDADEDCSDGVDNNCDGDLDWNDGDCRGSIDADGDGYAATTDCDDDNVSVSPGSTETCGNGIDDDCSGSDLDCDDADLDLDGESVTDGDCDDSDSSINSSGIEVCNDGIDQNCDGLDTDCQDIDDDGDSFTENDGDCDDTDSTINPDSSEICSDGIDDDCSGGDLDCDDADQDGDGQSVNAGDCDDTDDHAYTGAPEHCSNAIDDDCDGDVDSSDSECVGTDYDGDGYVDFNDCDETDSMVNIAASEVCDDGKDNDCSGGDLDCDDVDDDGDGVTENEGDCDDSDISVSPDVIESCFNSTDDDCDGDIDLADSDCSAYVDSDGDGYAGSIDCNDADSGINPGASEVVGDGIDQDCSGSDLTVLEVDDDGDSYTEIDGDCDDSDATVGLASTWFADADSDGFGDVSNFTTSCTQPSGYVTDAEDCDDADYDVNPDAIEICNEIDDDCNGTIDDGVQDTWYRDADADGMGNALASTEACEAPEGYVADATDCDDADANFQTEVTYYLDWDADDFGDATRSYSACAESVGDYIEVAGDCDDSDTAVNPEATEICGNGIDDDCDGTDATCSSSDTGDTADTGDTGTPTDTDSSLPACTTDADSDSFIDSACEGGLDCNDADSTVNPGVYDVCGDTIDQNCDDSDAICMGSIVCADNGSNLDVTLTGDVAAGLMGTLSSVSMVGVQTWDGVAAVSGAYIDSVTPVTLTVTQYDFTPYATDGVSSMWFDLRAWSASGTCSIASDGAGGLEVSHTP